MQTLYLLIADSGDGSGYIQYFTDKELVDALLDNDDYCEKYWMNDGSPKKILLPDIVDINMCGIEILTRKDFPESLFD
jgi:hypothetical protein